MKADLTPRDRIEKINEAWSDIFTLTVMLDSIAEMDHDDKTSTTECN